MTATSAASAVARGEDVEHLPLRLALFSPVAPTPSGIAAYTADLLPLLPEPWVIDVYTDPDTAAPEVASGSKVEGLGASAPGGDRPAGCFAHREFSDRHAATAYDLNIYQAGNSTGRAWMLDYVLQHPGLLVLHDGVVHAARIEASTAAGELAAYRRVAARCSRDSGRAVGHLVAGGLGGPALYSTFPLCEDLVAASLVTAMHGEVACQWLRALVPGCSVTSLAHWRSVNVDDEARRGWRRRLGGADEVVVGSFGNIGGERRLDRAFRALADIDSGRRWRLAVVGAVDARLHLDHLADALGIADRIDWLPGLGDADFVAVMAAVDLAINLRYPQARASSGVLHQLLQLGVPTLVSDVLHWRDYPGAAVARIPPGPDEAEDKALRAALAKWIVNPDARAAAAGASRAWAAAHITPQRMRDGYVGAVGEALARRAAGEQGATGC